MPTGLVLGGSFVQSNTPLSDGTLGSSDVDFYQLTAPAGSNLKAVTSQPAGGTAVDTVLRLFDSTGTPLAASDNSSGYSRLDYYPFTTSGTYYVGVSGVTGSTGDYRLDLTLDIGDTLGTATDTGLAGTGSFAQASTRIGDGHFETSDVDLYEFSAAANGVLMAVTSQPAGGAPMDTFLRLFDSAGTELAAENNSPLYSRLHYVFATAGTFYVGVSGFSNTGYDPTVGGSGSPGSTGNYRLDLTVTALCAAEFELSTLLAANADGSRGFAVSGIVDRGALGGPIEYQPVGDINGDHIDDFLLSAPSTSVNPPVSGQAYLIFGRPGGFPTELDLHSLDATTGYVLGGVQALDGLGISGGGAGDLNHDGLPDLVLGAYWASPSSDRSRAGQTYVLFGGSLNLAALDIADGAQDGRINLAALDGTNGFTINGTAANAYAGRAVDAAGDVNADGIDDLVIGANGIGTDYVVFGRDSDSTETPPEFFPAVLELSSLDGANGFSIPQLVAYDYVGYSVAGAGDVNGDGVADLLLGAYGADPSGRSLAGQAYLIFGRASFPAVFSLASLDGSTGFTINGSAAFDYLGYEVDGAGDVNADGVDDVLIGAYGVDISGQSAAGAAYVLFGKVTATHGPFAATLEVSALDGFNGVALNGYAAGGQAGYRLSGVGDINRDGYDDVVLNAPYADPNNLTNAGQSYLVYGGPSFGPSFDLARLLAANGGDGSNGLVLNGFAANDLAGYVAGLGDINADGVPDLRVGSPYADPNGLMNAGQAYIVYGKPSAPAIRVMPATGLTTTEAGGTASFSVMLTTQPAANVTIPVSSSDLTEGRVSVSGLTFTPANWKVPQSVTVTGVDDAFSDGNVGYTILLGAAASSDPTYSGLDPVNVSVTNVDNDIFTTTFTKTENASIPDRGTYTSSLTVAPIGRILDLDVRVNITHQWDEDLDVFLIAPDGTRTELFTDVGGMGVNFSNTVLDNEAVTPITSGSAPFTGTYRPEGNLTLVEGKNLAGTWKLEVTDDERWGTGTLVDWSIMARYTPAAASGPEAIVTPTSGLVTTEAGGTASFTVRLDNAPTASVTIPVSSSDTSEGTVSTSSLIFTSSNWNVAQTVTVTGVDDTVVDGNVGYRILLDPATSADPDFNGLNPTDVSVTNIDNEIVPTEFYVVNDASQDQTYEYSVSGGLVESYSLNSGNTAPRGVATTIAGNKVWVVDANRKVYVYDTSGGLLGSWTAGTLAANATVEDITVYGSDVWMVDAKSDKVFRYNGAASRLSGSQNATSSFSLDSGNTNPKGMVTDGTYLWVVNDSTTDKVFKYTMAGQLVGSWICSGTSKPTGITIDPGNVSNIWIVDSSARLVWQYTAAASRTSGSQGATVAFALAAGNTNPQGIADPPSPGSMVATEPRAPAASVSRVLDAAFVGLSDGQPQTGSSKTTSTVAVKPRADFSTASVLPRTNSVVSPPVAAIRSRLSSAGRRGSAVPAVDHALTPLAGYVRAEAAAVDYLMSDLADRAGGRKQPGKSAFDLLLAEYDPMMWL